MTAEPLQIGQLFRLRHKNARTIYVLCSVSGAPWAGPENTILLGNRLDSDGNWAISESYLRAKFEEISGPPPRGLLRRRTK